MILKSRFNLKYGGSHWYLISRSSKLQLLCGKLEYVRDKIYKTGHKTKITIKKLYISPQR